MSSKSINKSNHDHIQVNEFQNVYSPGSLPSTPPPAPEGNTGAHSLVPPAGQSVAPPVARSRRVWLTTLIVFELLALGYFGTDYIRSTLRAATGTDEGARMAQHDGVELGFLESRVATLFEEETGEPAVTEEESSTGDSVAAPIRTAEKSSRRSSERRARRLRLSTTAEELTKPDETNVDGLTGASKTWVPPRKEAEPKVAARTDPDELDQLVGSALSGPEARKEQEGRRTNTLAELVTGELPATPSRAQVKRSMDAVATAVKACGEGAGGRIKLELGVAGATGRVVSARATRDSGFAGTPVGICAARKVRLAKLPPFKQGRLVIKYPFDL